MTYKWAQNDLRLKITFSKIERAHPGIPDLSIYKVNFVFQLIDFFLVYHGQSQPWVCFFFFFLFFSLQEWLLGPLSGSPFPKLPILSRIVLLSTLALITTITANKIEAKLFFRQMRLFKRVYNMNALSIPPIIC